MKNTETFLSLSSVNVQGSTEKKGNLTYLSWAHAWAEASKIFTVTRHVYENEHGWNYHTDGKTCWVKIGVKIDGVEHIDYLPIMDFNNKSISVEMVTSFDVNKAIQRSTTKALALHGLGLNVYAGEDLPMTQQAPPISEVSAWIERGKTIQQCIDHLTANFVGITPEYLAAVKEL